jgi:hypothetical protein
VDRRSFILSTGSLALVGCTSDSAGNVTSLVPLGSDEGTLDLVVMFPPSVIAAGLPLRLPFGLLSDGVFVLGPGGEDVKVQLFNDSNGSLAFEGQASGRVVAHAHSENVAPDHSHADVIRYFAPTVTIPSPGLYRFVVTSGDKLTVLGLTALDQSQVLVPGIGQPMPSVDTPTVDNPGDVDPICTRSPVCEFHDHTPAEMLAQGKPFVLLIATPSFCQTEFCGPVLDVLIGVQPDFADITMIHAEVYENPIEVGGNLGDPNLRPAPVLQAMAMDYEPSLFIVGSDGLVMHRLDNVYDESELRSALEDVV